MNDDAHWVRVASRADVFEGSSLGVPVAGGYVAVHHMKGGEVFATSDVCSHEHARLSEGWINGYVVECPLHGGQFDVRTGFAVRAPATQDIATFEIELRGDEIWLKLDATALEKLRVLGA